MKWIAVISIIFFFIVPVSADYALQVQALTNSPADGATVYMSGVPTTPYSTVNLTVIVIPEDGILHTAEIYDYSGTAGTAEAYSYYVRKNNAVDYLIQTKTVSASERVFSNTSLGIDVVAGDWIEIKRVQPTWATNPLTNIVGGYVLINTTPTVNTNLGYPMQVMLQSNSPADATTNFASWYAGTFSTTNGLFKMKIPANGTINRAWVNDYSGTAGTAESWYYYSDVRNGVTSNELITNFTVSAKSRQAWNTSLNQVATIVDKFTFKRVNPTWATNPLTNLLYGYSYVDVDSSLDSPRGYPLFVEAISYSPVDAQTTYFGNRPIVPSTTAATNKIYIRQNGTITKSYIWSYSGTAGTSESWPFYIRKNNAADYLIETKSVSAQERAWDNVSLSIPVVAGDYLEIKQVNPTWATNPATTILGGYVYLEYLDLRPLPSFTSNVTFGDTPLAVQFNDTSVTDPIAWDWMWNCTENNTLVHFSTDQNPVGIFDEGHFHIYLNVTNASGMQTSTATYTISSTPSGGYEGFTQQDIFMEGQYLQTFHLTSTEDGYPIGGVLIDDGFGNQNTTLSNGTGWLTEPFGLYSIIFTKDGYNGKMVSYVFDEDKSHSVQLTPVSTGGVSTTHWSATHDVVFYVRSLTGTPVEGVNITATYMEQSGGEGWLESWAGIPGDINVENTTLAGQTGSDGAIDFLMVQSAKYHVTAYKSGVIDAYMDIYPKDDYYVFRQGFNSSVFYEHGADETKNIRFNVSRTELNETYGRIRIEYTDLMDQTTQVVILVNNSTSVGNLTTETTVVSYTSTAAGNFTYNFDMEGTRGNSYLVRCNSTGTVFPEVKRDYGVTFLPGPITLGIPEEFLVYAGMFVLIFIALCFTRTLPGPAVIVIMFFAWIFYMMRWWRDLGPDLIVGAALVFFTVAAVIFNVMIRSKKRIFE